jgi:class 3 adenylate cyclase
MLLLRKTFGIDDSPLQQKPITITVGILDDNREKTAMLEGMLKRIEGLLLGAVEIKFLSVNTVPDFKNKFLRQNRIPDILLSDVELEDPQRITGLTLLEWIQQGVVEAGLNYGILKNTRKYVITSSADDRNVRNSATDLGAIACLDKPANAKEEMALENKLSEIIKETRASKMMRDREALATRLNKLLVPTVIIEKIMHLGYVPEEEMVSLGVINFDLVDFSLTYNFINNAKKTSMLLAGIWELFDSAIHDHKGLMLKRMGDGALCTFGGQLDEDYQKDNELIVLAKRSFGAAVEIQRRLIALNRLDEGIAQKVAAGEPQQNILKAIEVLREQKNRVAESSSEKIYQEYQLLLLDILSRIGVGFGETLMGLLGSSQYKSWDIIGLSANASSVLQGRTPPGCLRICQEHYDILDRAGFWPEYYQDFIKLAKEKKSVFAELKYEEFIMYEEIKGKHDEPYKTYLVQVVPDLPEMVVGIVSRLITKGSLGRSFAINFSDKYKMNRLIKREVDILLKNGSDADKERSQDEKKKFQQAILENKESIVLLAQENGTSRIQVTIGGAFRHLNMSTQSLIMLRPDLIPLIKGIEILAINETTGDLEYVFAGEKRKIAHVPLRLFHDLFPNGIPSGVQKESVRSVAG